MNSTLIKPMAALSILGSLVLFVTACSEKPKAQIKTLETVKAQGAVDAYDATGSKELKLKAEQSFVALDREIKELEVRVEATTGDQRAEAAYKLKELKKRESEIRADFNEAKFNTLINDIKNSVR